MSRPPSRGESEALPASKAAEARRPEVPAHLASHPGRSAAGSHEATRTDPHRHVRFDHQQGAPEVYRNDEIRAPGAYPPDYWVLSVHAALERRPAGAAPRLRFSVNGWEVESKTNGRRSGKAAEFSASSQPKIGIKTDAFQDRSVSLNLPGNLLRQLAAADPVRP